MRYGERHSNHFSAQALSKVVDVGYGRIQVEDTSSMSLLAPAKPGVPAVEPGTMVDSLTEGSQMRRTMSRFPHEEV